ncbi:MAG: type I restriction enzyme S subunit [Bacteroidia bacterium]|jgi:type I restriction enzyme S subunit
MQLLQHFSALTLHPANAKELKGLILQLAVEGKLTKKWRADNQDAEPASELLKRIQKEKEQLVKDKKIRKEKPLESVDEDDTPYSLPIHWNWTRLGNLGFAQTGSTPPKNNPAFYGDHIPFVGPAHISNEKMTYPSEGLSVLGIAKGRLIPKDSLMMVCIGGSIGKCNVNEVDVSCNQQINTVTPIFNDVGIVKVICQSPYFQRSLLEKHTGSATPIVNKGKWETILVPLPPLEEQKAIVHVVEELFAEVEQLEKATVERVQLKEQFVVSSLQQLTTLDSQEEWAALQPHFNAFLDTKSNIKKLRETILQLAVQGKLTQKWRTANANLEPASELLLRIQKEKQQLIKDKKIKKEKPLPPIDTDDVPYALPEGWEWCRMGEISEKLGAGSTPSGGKAAYEPKGTMFFRSQNIHNDGLRVDNVALINRKTHTKMKGTHVRAKDILLNITGGSIGRSTLIPDDFDTANVSQHVAIVRMVDLEIREYIHNLIISEQFQQTIMDVQVGVSREGLSMTKLKLFLIPLPPLEEQKAIVEKVNSLMALCDELEQHVAASNQQLQGLMKSCLKEVVEG